MPDMDFSAVLSSREFQDTFSVTSTARVMGDGGVEVDTPSLPRTTRGIVIPGKLSLNRQADGSRVAAYIDIFTKARLTAGFKTDDTNSRDADLVKWRGRTYTVMSVEDYGAFGTGFYKASCDLLPLSSPN